MNLQGELSAVVGEYGSYRALEYREKIPKSSVAALASQPDRDLTKHKKLYNTIILLRRLYRKKFADPWPDAINTLLDGFVELETRFGTGVIHGAAYRRGLDEAFLRLEALWNEGNGNPIHQAGCLYAHATLLYDYSVFFGATLPLVRSERVALITSQYQRACDILSKHAKEAFAKVIDKIRLNILATEMMSSPEAWALSDAARARVRALDALGAAKRLAEREPMNLDLMNDGLQVASTSESLEDCQYFWALLTQELPFGINPWREPEFAQKRMKGITGARMGFFYNEVYRKDLVPHYV